MIESFLVNHLGSEYELAEFVVDNQRNERMLTTTRFLLFAFEGRSQSKVDPYVKILLANSGEQEA